MPRDRPRWSEAADDVRRRGPDWLDLDRSPWWLWVLVAVVGGAWGVRAVVAADGIADSAAGLVVTVMLPAGALLGARNLRRGQPFLGAPDRRVGPRVLMGVLVLLLVLAGWAFSGQQSVSGRLVGPTGSALGSCELTRDGRIGVGLGGGFDAEGHATDREGRFTILLARGLNTLLFECQGLEVRTRVLVVRGLDPDRTLTAGD